MKRSLLVVTVSGWTIAAANIVFAWQEATLSSQLRRASARNGSIVLWMLYASIVVFIAVLLLKRGSTRRQQFVGLSGPIVTMVVFVLSLLRMILALLGAHIT